MKIELKKETSIDGIWYIITVDGDFTKCKRDLEDAEKEYNKLLKMAKRPTTTKIIKSINI